MHDGCEGLKRCVPHSLLTPSARMAYYIDGWSDVCSGGAPASCVQASQEPAQQEAELPAASSVGPCSLGLGGLDVFSDARSDADTGGPSPPSNGWLSPLSSEEALPAAGAMPAMATGGGRPAVALLRRDAFRHVAERPKGAASRLDFSALPKKQRRATQQRLLRASLRGHRTKAKDT